jgi:hypothetical protein
MASRAHRRPRRDNLARWIGRVAGVLAPHVAASGAPVPADRDHQRDGSPAQRLVRQTPCHGVARCSFASTASAPLIRFDDPAGQRRPIRHHVLAGDFEPEPVGTSERGQIRIGEARIGGSAKHAGVFWSRVAGHGYGVRTIRPNTVPLSI